MSLEIDGIQKWLGAVQRHPRQTHGLNESDSEIVALGRGRFLASTIDSIAEEISYGLYQDPFTMGWMCATASLSDLAAVGAKPLGLLFSAHWQHNFTLAQKKRVVLGLKAALKLAHTPLLGGDTGQAPVTQLTSVGLGICDSKPPGRTGLKPGDLICVTGKMGLGPALGFRKLMGDPKHIISEKDYRPRARLTEGLQLRSHVSAMMDTSDGLASTLHTLCRLNGVSLELQWSESWLDAKALRYCQAMKLPPVSLLFGEHGDFQLVAGVRSRNLADVQKRVKDLHIIGKIVSAAKSTQIRIGHARSQNLKLGFVADARKDSLAAIGHVFKKMLKYSATL